MVPRPVLTGVTTSSSLKAADLRFVDSIESTSEASREVGKGKWWLFRMNIVIPGAVRTTLVASYQYY